MDSHLCHLETQLEREIHSRPSGPGVGGVGHKNREGGQETHS